MHFDDHIQHALSDLKSRGLLRRARAVSGAQGPRLVVDGREVLCLCSNNYLGLADDPALADAALRATREEGFGAGASRLISGSMQAHAALESALAEFLGYDDAALFTSGYAANVGTLQGLVGRGDIIFSDSLNHASLIDGARLSRAKIVVFNHADADDLESKLNAHRAEGRAALVVTESLFSMDGDTPPLARIADLALQHEAALVVDEAHALGVFGREGRGLCEQLSVRPDVVVGTLGKAFGVQGAFVASSEPAIRLLRNRSRSYVFSTAPAAPVARVALAALERVRQGDSARARLLDHAAHLRAGLQSLGYDVPDGDSQIIPLIVGDPEPTMSLSLALLENGVFAHGIRPPTVPPGTGRLRIVPMASHTRGEIDHALAVFAAVRR